MILIWACFGAWILFFCVRGFSRGLIETLVRAIAFAATYAIAWFGAPFVTPFIAEFVDQDLVAKILAGTLLFATVGLIFGAAIHVLLVGYRKQVSLPSRVAGGIAGAAIGLLSGLVIVWLASALYTLWSAQGGMEKLKEQPFFPKELTSAANGFMSELATAGVKTTPMKELHGKMLAAMMADPQVFIEGFAEAANDKVMDRLMADPESAQYLATGDVAGLKRTPAFRSFADHKGVKQMSELAFGEENVDTVLAEKTIVVWQRVDGLKNDPEIQQLLRDPEVVALMREGNPAKLLMNPKVSRIVDRVMNDETPVRLEHDTSREEAKNELDSYSSAELDPSEGVDLNPPRDNRVYQWVDDNGRIQFSDYDSIPISKRNRAVQIAE